jgi:predicted glycosyl hydrolase (DUF1957 family)
MLWLNFLHLYQPVNTDAHIIREATELSYKRIIRALKESPDIHFTLNINGSLLLRWEDLGYDKLIKDIHSLIEKGQIELSGTACYHPLLPLIPENEIRQQIKENEALLQKHFGSDFKPAGFFLPEMAYGENVAKIIAQSGYQWIILDEISGKGALGALDTERYYTLEGLDLSVIFRSRRHSSTFVPKTINHFLNSDKTIITATDGELYGLRHLDQTGEFEALLHRGGFDTMTISQFISKNDSAGKVKPLPSNWESSLEDLEQNKPYFMWQDHDNPIHAKLWELADLAYKTSEKFSADENHYWSRWHLVRGLASCTFWWASGKDFSHIFGPHAWNPDEIERGMNEFIRSIRAIEDVASRATKVKAENLFIDLKKMIWEKHWTSHWKNEAS